MRVRFFWCELFILDHERCELRGENEELNGLPQVHYEAEA